MEMKEVRATARELMKGYCRVCPVCDGRVCAGEVPGMGGLGTGAAFRANVEALARVRLNMRLLHDTTNPDLSVTVLGKELALPVLAAPIGGVSFNMGGKHSEEEYISAVLSGCLARGTLGCTGDGVPAFIHETAFKVMGELNGEAIPFIKPWEDAELYDKLGKAAEAGARIAGIDVDAAGLVTLAKMGRPVTPKSPQKIRDIIDRFPMQFIIKGIMTPDEALKACDAGAAGVVVSNHGGRVLDFTPGVAEVLPRVAAAVKGQMAVLADGGIRTGVDVLKMLALGADAVLIGRPFSIAAMGGLQEGVTAYLDQLAGELRSALVLTGTAKVSCVEPDILYK